MDALVHALHLLALLPPPPRPDAAPGGDGSGFSLPLGVWLAISLIAAFGLGLVGGRVRGARGTRAAAPPPTYRIDLWRNGEAKVLGYTAAADNNAVLERHLAAMRAKRVRGAVVLIEPVSDTIVALRSLTAEEPPWTRHPARRWAAAPQPVVAAR